MPRRSKGLRSKGRGKFRKEPRMRGKFSVVQATQELPVGGKVAVIIEPTVTGGQPHHRYHGRVGVVREKRGKAYVIEIKDGGKVKTLVVGREHLRMVA
jgi:large subunit ribosomal protein L21e